MNDAMPHNIEAERALLGAAIQWPDKVLDDAATAGLKGWHFYRPEHQQLFGLLVEMERDGEPINLVTIPEKIQRSGKGGDYGGLAYVVELPDYSPSASAAAHYARSIVEDRRRRTIVEAMDGLRTVAMDGVSDPQAVADVAIGKLLDSGEGQGTGGWVALGETLKEVVAEVEEQLANPERAKAGASTGFRDLDAMLGGLFPGDLVVIAGRPAMGKSALSMQVGEYVAAHTGPVGVFSLEMPRIQLAKRSACSAASVNVGRMRAGRLDRDEVYKLQRAMLKRPPKLFVDDKSNLTIGEVAARARRLERQEGQLALIVIDYLQIMGEELEGRNSRERQIAHMSKRSKDLAKDLNCPVILVSQLNRGVEQRKDKKPIMSDLRESGAIEQDADVIIFMFRGEYYWPNEPMYLGQAEAIIAKQRNGPTGVVDLIFEGEYTRFRDLTAGEMAAQARAAQQKNSTKRGRQ